MNRAVSLIRNKYMIASVIFAVWMLFFDRHDLTTQYDYYVQRKALEQEKEFYDREISRISRTLDDLEKNPAAIERIGREKYQMKKADEDVYVILRH